MLHISKDDKPKLPVDAVTQTFAIFGKRGSGKSNTGVVLAEEMFKAGAPVVVLDPVSAWWGIKSSFDGKSPGLAVHVFGGPHGDLPLQPTAGELMAQVFIEHRISMVLDMKGWSGGERAHFVTDFALWLLGHNERHPIHVFLEEADAFIPQRPFKGEERMVGAMDRLVRWGRQEGIGATLITQRSAKANKDVTTQAETLIAHRTTGPQDRDAIDHWIRYHAGDDKRQEVLSTLPTLPDGTAWVWSPEWLQILKQVAIRRRETFDSASTPKLGEKRRAPKELAAVDLEKLRGKLSATIEKAKADDPRELRKKIADLEKQLAAKPSTAPDPAARQRHEDFLTKANNELTLLRQGVKERDRAIAKLTGVIKRAGQALGIDLPGVPDLPIQTDLAGKNGESVSRSVPAPARVLKMGAENTVPDAQRPATRRRHAPQMLGELGLGRAETAILRAAYWLRDEDPSKQKLAFYADYSSKSSGTDKALSNLRTAGLMAGMRITADGIAALGKVEEKPRGAELREWLRAHLGQAENALLDALIEAHPQRLSKQEVAERSGYSDRSSGTDKALSNLRTIEAAEGGEREGGTKAADVFFE